MSIIVKNESNTTSVGSSTILAERNHFTPESGDINIYAMSIGIDLAMEPELEWIAKEGITAPLPKGWQVLQDENNQIFYYQKSSCKSSWEHPLDDCYRKLAERARLKKKDRQDNVSKVSLSSGRSSFTTTALPPVKQQLPITSTPICGITPVAETSDCDLQTNNLPQVRSTDDPITDPQWTGTPVLGDDVRGPSLASENPSVTEYANLVPSQCDCSSPTCARQNSLFLMHSRTPLATNSTSSQTTEDNQIPQSKACPTTSSKPTSLPNAREKFKNFQSGRTSLPVPSPTSCHKPLHSTHLSMSGQCGDSSYPQLGDSPTDEQIQKSRFSLLSAIPEKSISLNSNKSPLGDVAKSVDNEENIENCPSSQTPVNSHELVREERPVTRDAVTSTIPTTCTKFTDGLHHLIEERSRLQQKMLRVKIIYKTYKQRLNSLDSSLRLLQHPQSSVNTVSSKQNVPPSSVRQNNRHDPIPFLSATDLCLPLGEKTVHPEVVTIRELSPISPTVYHHVTKQRSLSLPHQTVSLATKRSIYTTPLYHQPITEDLVESLTKVDDQLHSVLHNLKSPNCTTAPCCDQRLHEQHVARPNSTVHAGYLHRSTDLASEHLGVQLADLSIDDDDDHRDTVFRKRNYRKYYVGDFNALGTPTSPDVGSKREHGRPQLDASPSWLNSD